MTQVTKFVTALTILSFVSACGTQRTAPASASDIDQTSLCLIDQKGPVRPGPAPNEDGSPVNDPGNMFDTDATTDWLLEHNGRLDAACTPG